jgi:hypothetical protein
MDLVAMETDENIISKSNAFFNSFKFSFHFDFKHLIRLKLNPVLVASLKMLAFQLLPNVSQNSSSTSFKVSSFLIAIR